MNSYTTIDGRTVAEIEEKKSRFIASLAHVETEEEALAFLDEIRVANRMARHNVYAYVLREGGAGAAGRVRYSDDGEPQKTAGMPTLEALQHAGLTDVICVVTRYFGGVLLGTGGLVRAYTKAAADAAAKITKAVMTPGTVFSAECDYSSAERLAKLIADAGGSVENTVYTENVRYEFFISDTEKQKFTDKLKETFCARITAEKLKNEARPVEIK